jgi:hypothetical protein
MGIIGLDDKPVLRRDGKIRAGYKEETGGKLVNTEHFLLHDAPELERVLGEKPTEIYFTVHSDRKDDFYKTDLRWYNASQLMCFSMHNALDESGKSMGSVAAFKGVGQNAVGLKQQPFPGVDKARVRVCNYKSCPDYVRGDCGEHLFLDVIVPQCSMVQVFTLDSSSINAILNMASTLTKTANLRRYAGEIFRMHKKPGQITYQNKAGKQSKRDAPMVSFDWVPFEDYEAKFKDQIHPRDWEILLGIRANRLRAASDMPILPPATDIDDTPQLPSRDNDYTGGEADQPPEIGGNVPTEDSSVEKRANDPLIVELCGKYAELVGRENTEAARISTAKNFASVQECATYLRNRIKEVQKEKAQPAPANPQFAPASSAPPQGEVVDMPAESGDLY